MKKYVYITLILVLVCLCTACGYSGPKLPITDYHQAALLYDGLGNLSEEEISGRYWRLCPGGLLQSKWEARDGFTDYGTGEEYYVSPSKLKKMFPHPQLYDAAAEYTKKITDGRLYTTEDRSILLLKGSDDHVLLGMLDDEGMLNTLFLLEMGEIPPTKVPLNHTWNPYAVAPLYDDLFGHRFSIDFRAMVSAIMNGDKEFYCSDLDNAYRLTQYCRAVFPPYEKIVANVFFDKGMGHIIYKTNDKNRITYLDNFRFSVESIINEALQQGDSEAAMAVALYHAYADRITYDYDAVLDDKADVTPYRGLTEFSGICQSFAPAYAYLCTQVGINAVTAGGLSENNEAHDWTLLKLDGEFFYADTTWEATDGGTGMKYFGLTTDQRYEYGLFTPRYINIANSNSLWGTSIAAISDRFADLQQITTVDSFWRENGVMTVRGYNASGEYIEFIVD